MLKERSDLKNDLIKDYIEEIVDEAQLLADVWDQMDKSLIDESEPNIKSIDKAGLEKLRYKYGGFNGMPYFTLQSFYRRLSTALGGKLSSEWIDLIINSVSRILYHRNFTRQLLLDSLDKLNVTGDEFESKINTDHLMETVSILRKEATALKTLQCEIALNKFN